MAKNLLILVLMAINFANGALITVKNNIIEAEILNNETNDEEIIEKIEVLPVYTLQCEGVTGFCYATEINLNETHRYFTPASTIPANMVKVIHLGGYPNIFNVQKGTSAMHTLTANLCQAFPNLKMIDAKYLNLEEIEEDALRDCVNLEAIFLANNNIQKIHQNLFKHNKNLEKIRLEDNRITQIDLTLFENLRHLNELGFDGQLLDEFHVNKVRHRGIIKLVLRFSDRAAMELGDVGILQHYKHLSSFIPCYRDPSYDVYFHLLDSHFMRVAKLYCFVRPGNDAEKKVEEVKMMVEEEVIAQNTIENITE